MTTTPCPPAEPVPSLRGRWLEALRSGRYPQDRGHLRSDRGFCCLGVLCDVSGTGTWERSDGTGEFQFSQGRFGYYGLLPASLRESLGLSWDLMQTLIRMNDLSECSFVEIADYAEAHL